MKGKTKIGNNNNNNKNNNNNTDGHTTNDANFNQTIKAISETVASPTTSITSPRDSVTVAFGADEFLPCFMLLVLRAKPLNFYQNIQYINKYRT